MRKSARATRNDVAPPGREAQVKKLKEVSSVDNPYAVAWASYNDDDDEEIDDGLSGLAAGGKPGPEGDDYEAQTLGDEPFKHGENMDDDDDSYLLDDDMDLNQRDGHPVGAMHQMHGAAGTPSASQDDDSELLDDSEVEGGENLPHNVAAPSDPAAHGPHAAGVEDPEPENFGRKRISVEGVSVNA